MLNRYEFELGAGQGAIELVQQSAVRRGKQFPGDRAEKRRRHERGRHQRPDGLSARHVGARYQPADRGCDQAADHRRGGGDDRGGQQRVKEIRIGEQRDEVLQRRMPRLVGERIDCQPRQRQRDQHHHAKRNQRQYRLGPVDAGFGGGGGGCDGHAISIFPVIPGRAKREPGISRFRVWSFRPSRNDVVGWCTRLLTITS